MRPDRSCWCPELKQWQHDCEGQIGGTVYRYNYWSSSLTVEILRAELKVTPGVYSVDWVNGGTLGFLRAN